MVSRPLQAVQFRAADGDRMLAALAAALDGSGPAILPLDPDLPAPARNRILADCATGVADDTAVVIATSGSTGHSKAVELSAAALTASATASLHRIGARRGERWLCCLPTFHVSGLGVLVRSLVTGVDPVIAAGVSPEVIADSGCAYISLVPTQLRRLLDAGCRPGGLAAVLIGGAAPGESLLAEARAAGWPLITTYGMSETSGGCVYDGVPLKDVQVRVTDGLVEIAGPTLFSGYLGQPELTSAVLGGGWFRTADLGSWRPDGSLVIRGRADDVINTGGEKVVPGEVEAVLGTSPGVADVVVVGLPDRDWGETVTAVVIPADPSKPPDLTRLRSDARDVLSAYAAPRRVVVVPEFPLLPSGKPDRVALRELVLRKVALDRL
ncbi:MAG: AMP-binding protein [Actinobacteria bacterium]|nr:AMP-binding protein [Actinomycetota bacterium]